MNQKLIHEHIPHVGLKPIIILRWLACLGQLCALMVAYAVFDWALPYPELVSIIAVSCLFNLWSMTRYKQRNQSETVVFRQIMFDILQFSAVLYYTGGIDNPFSILFLAPLVLGASLLSLYRLCLLIILSIISCSILTFWHLGLTWPTSNQLLYSPELKASWVAQLLALIFISFIVWRTAVSVRILNNTLSQTRAILAEQTQATALGALAAAIVHELGSPLATIAVITREMERDMHPDDPLYADLLLLKEQTDRCKKILETMSQNPQGLALPQERVRLDRFLLELTALPKAKTTIKVTLVCSEANDLPYIQKRQSLYYGLNNLVSNAIDFAHNNVTLTLKTAHDRITLLIEDDGKGFSESALMNFGKPYITERAGTESHMGLGIFIAILLLQESGADVRFSNNAQGGAHVTVDWPRKALEQEQK